MARPTFLVIEPEPLDSLSTRKLVLETAKFNVITAHSTSEGIELLKTFPNVQALVIVASLNGCSEVVKSAKALDPKLPVVILSPNFTYECEGDHHASTHEPEELLRLLRRLFGDPRSKSQ
jgi:Response regulator consisting of a CheY-like receiver domain and a Fis-type HTH domain